MIEFSLPREHLADLMEIADRAEASGLVNARYPRMTLIMDLSACHAQCPIDFAALAKADGFNFSHDVCGIARHMDRETGLLTDCFVPRFAKKESAA